MLERTQMRVADRFPFPNGTGEWHQRAHDCVQIPCVIFNGSHVVDVCHVEFAGEFGGLWPVPG